MHDNERSLLYLTPVLPAVGGNGLAMRAGAVLRVLARRHAVTLVVRPHYPPRRGRLSPELAELCERVAMLRPRGQPPGPLKRLLSLLGGERQEPAQPALPFPDHRFEVIHVFRLSMVDVARRYAAAPAARNPEIHLDLDDIESDVLQGLAQLHRANGRLAAAEAASRAAHAAWTLENEALTSFDRIYVCSDSDLTLLAPAPGLSSASPQHSATAARSRLYTRWAFQFLFVGTLGYPPNDDAVVYFAPRLFPHRAADEARFPRRHRGRGRERPVATARASSADHLRRMGAAPRAAVRPGRSGGRAGTGG